MDTLFYRSDGAPAPHSSDLKDRLTNLLSLLSRFSNKRMEFIPDHCPIFMRLPWGGTHGSGDFCVQNTNFSSIFLFPKFQRTKPGFLP
jgi:hypothetical protein